MQLFKHLHSGLVARMTAVLAAAPAGLAAGRLLFEALFPAGEWLGQTPAALLTALLAGAGGVWLGRHLDRENRSGRAILPLLPLLLNIIYLADPAAGQPFGRFLLGTSLWLSAALLFYTVESWRRHSWLLLPALLLPVYLLTLGQTVGQADTFEFQVVIPRLGIVHPTGYPLYLLLSKLFTFLPLGEVAWRINLATATYALGAVLLLYLLLLQLTGRPLPALLAAALFGLSPTFWSQAVAAEVYTLHGLLLAAALLLVLGVRGWGLGTDSKSAEGNWTADSRRLAYGLAFVLGLGLTNHLTTLVLLPGAGLALFFARRKLFPDGFSRESVAPALRLLLFFLLPLLLYAYLPLRWAAVNGEPMGLNRFVDWVIGGRFQGALQLQAWLRDPARYSVVGRLLASEWSYPALIWAGLGFLYLAWRRWRLALILGGSWLGFIFYALNYYVPDLAVFLIPAHLLITLFWGLALAGLFDILPRRGRPLAVLLAAAWMAAVFIGAGRTTWPAVDRSHQDGLTGWGRAVLSQPLDPQGAILADSEKIAPLYYLQQVEALQPEMDMVVLPDEAAYRADLGARLAAGQSVYLARFIPGLEGSYHLRSTGPLTEVGLAPLTTLPAGSTAANLTFGPIRLIGYQFAPDSPYDPGRSALTLYWQAEEKPQTVQHVYLRWAEGGSQAPAGQHPANNYYPTVAWTPGEIVPDFHQLPRPILNEPAELALQVALAPPFTAPEQLQWQTVLKEMVTPRPAVELQRPLQARLGSAWLLGAQFPDQIRPEAPLELLLAGCGVPELVFSLQPAGQPLPPAGEVEDGSPAADCAQPQLYRVEVDTAVAAGRYRLAAVHPSQPARCGWLAQPAGGCWLGKVVVSGLPLPEGAVNFDDKIALLEMKVPELRLQPGRQLAVHLRWQALAEMEENYTVFIQVLDAQDRIVGQVDVWPLQGTFPTGQWTPGEIVDDPHLVQLDGDLPPGPYRLQVGWYLLGTLQRLPVLNETGAAVDDKVVLPGLVRD